MLRSSKRLWRRFRKESVALDELDRKLARHIKGRGGFFVEAGANDGITFSNTVYFERYYGWHGLLVEPIPHLFQQCRENRPNCLVEQAALVSLDHVASSIRMRYCNMMSLVVGAMKSPEADEHHIRTGAELQSLEPYDLNVPAMSLSALLDRHGIDEVDLLSLDVEGYERQALLGIDFSRHRPRHILVEARFRDEIDQILADSYEPVEQLSLHDVLYRRRAA